MISQKFKELDLFIEYGVPAAQQEQARALVDKFSHDPLAINIFHSFYSTLPDAVEDCIEGLFLLEQHQGQMLFWVKTTLSSYFYMVNNDKAAYGGSQQEGIREEFLQFYGFGDQESFEKKFNNFSELAPYSPDFITSQVCPVCYCREGELHEFGCPVEVCPWCDGQLINCNCRFEQLGVTEITSDSQLDLFLQRAKKKGRITYDAASQRPAYPTAGNESKKTQ
ncbi:MAG: hypothetical protein KKD73_12145 [Proteobacteria bacterium]|nr:hypothetical protein [Pseudomonadota bacterium]